MFAGPYSGDFSEPIDPEQLLATASSPVWGGQMLPDTLPILENGSGDALCLRFATNGTVNEVARWSHDGSSWRPFGRSLHEAILCDVATSRAFDLCDADGTETGAVEQWASLWCRHSAGIRRILAEHPMVNPAGLLDHLLQVGVGGTALLREKCRSALSSALSEACHDLGWSTIAERSNLASHDFPTWLFDTSTIPRSEVLNMANALHMDVEVMTAQDWPTAESNAESAAHISPAIGWPYVILGRHAERRGRPDDAVDLYLQSLRCQKSSFDFLEMFGEQYALSRVLAAAGARESSLTDYLKVVIDSNLDSSAIREYWMSRARAAEREGRYDVAYRSYYNGGWDAYFSDGIAEVLDGLARSAVNAGYSALALIAEHHRECLETP